MNKDKIKKSVNLDELEKLELDGWNDEPSAQAKEDPDAFLNELLDTVSDMGINVDDDEVRVVEDDVDSIDLDPPPLTGTGGSSNVGHRPSSPAHYSERVSYGVEDVRLKKINELINPIEDVNKMEEHKFHMLSEIDQLRRAIELDNDLGLVGIPIVTPDSSYSEVQKVFRLLNAKNNNTRGRIILEEFFMLGAKTIESIFNGERVFFGKYKPNLTGWSGTLHHKFYRMRHDTSTLVSMISDGHVTHPLIKMALEIIPSAITYDAVNAGTAAATNKRAATYYQNAEKDLDKL